MSQVWSPSFVITADDGDSDAEARAKAVAGTCETDLKWLEAIFRCDFARNNYATVVDVMPAAGLGAVNEGWEPDRSSHIWINSTFNPANPPANAAYVRDEFARFLFVAEMAEILMDYTGYGWDRGGSNGEALSIVLATELHPDGYYLARQGPRVQNWLNRFPTEDWVSTTKPWDSDPTKSGDMDFVAFGCGIAFINYLRYQLGKDLSSIVCQPNCPTLADTFHALTGEGRVWAWPGFERLVRSVFPDGAPGDIRDNFFPLVEKAKRSARVELIRDTRISSVERKSKVKAKAGTVRFPPKQVALKAGPLCPKKAYPYKLFDELRELEFRAFCHGFGQASVRWLINGVPLPTHVAWDTVAIPATLTLPVPHRAPTAVAGAAKTRVNYLVVPAWNTSQLLIRNAETVGNSDITVTAIATETELNDGDTIAAMSWTLEEVNAELDPSYGEDARRCNPLYIEVGGALSQLSERLRLMLVAPDPRPEEAVARILAISQRWQRSIDAIAETTGVSPQELTRELSAPSTVKALTARSAQAPMAQRVGAAVGRGPAASRARDEAVAPEIGEPHVGEPVT